MLGQLETRSHSKIVIDHWKILNSYVDEGQCAKNVDGRSLDLAEIVAIARYGLSPAVDTGTLEPLVKSHDALVAGLAKGEIIYGVNTGFGGTADARTKQTEELQKLLIRELNYGILPVRRSKQQEASSTSRSVGVYDSSLEDGPDSKQLPWTWARGAMLIRINSLLKGYSGVRPVVVGRILDLLINDIVPIIPLRGSISASGDLSPLSYIGGAIQGKPQIRIYSKTDPSLTAKKALAAAGLPPITLAAKEGLAIVNGTAVSCAVGALAIHDAHSLALLSQLLTSMSVEALLGTAESFRAFFSEARPHPGQIEAAYNINAFLRGSSLVKVNNGTEASLRQDRYSIRTAPQWIGPILEDLTLAHQQIHIEANSATDNPLVTPEGEFLHGGNFQAKAVTSAMEKTRQAIQALGRMLYTQCTEMINPATNRGLPPNLVLEDPSLSYIFKGADLNVASLVSELGFLANPVNHVQTAEMGNQSLNSLALIAARYTHTANDVLSQLAAQHLVALCQALDIRACNRTFTQAYQPRFHALVTTTLLNPSTTHILGRAALEKDMWKRMLNTFDTTASLNIEARFDIVAKSIRDAILDQPDLATNGPILASLPALITQLATDMQTTWCQHRDAHLRLGSDQTATYLGFGARKVYEFVRGVLKVPILYSKVLETPDGRRSPAPEFEGADNDLGVVDGMTVGDYTARVYEAIRDGRLPALSAKILDEARAS